MSPKVIRALSIIIAASGIFHIVLVRFSRMLEPATARELMVTRVGQFCIVLLLVLIGMLVMSPRRLQWATETTLGSSILLSLLIASSLAPRFAVMVKDKLDRSNYAAGKRQLHENFLNTLNRYKKDIEERIARKSPYSANDGLAFLRFLRESDLTHRGLPSYLQDSVDLLHRAIKNNIIDPNERLEDGTPLYLAYYQPIYELAQAANVGVKKSDFAIFRVLLECGSDLSMKDASGRVIRDYIVLNPQIENFH